MRFAVIANNNVVNIIEATEDFALEGFTLVESDDAGISDTWDGAAFTKVPPSEKAQTPAEEEYSNASTNTAKINVIAKHLGLTG